MDSGSALKAPVSKTPDKTAQDFIPYCRHAIDAEEIQEVIDTLKSDWLTTGPRTLSFEREFSHYIGAGFAVGVNSCTAGLHLALKVSGVTRGDEVITTPLTFCATAEVIEYQQAKPIFVDVDPVSFNIAPEAIERSITSKTKAILPVHYGGIPCNMEEIYDIARRYNLPVIEDAAHAVGSHYQSQKIGSFGNLTVFSFYPTKNMTTGEGGMITTNNPEIAEQLKVLSLHGISKDAWKRYSSQGQWYYEVHELGYKYNLTDLQAALGIQQLKKLDDFNSTRERYAEIYFDALREVPEIKMPEWYHHYFAGLRNKGYRNSWHLFVIMLKPEKLSMGRNQFIDEMKSRGIGTSVHFIPLHLQPYYANKYNYKKGDFPVTEAIYKNLISLPLYPKLRSQQITRIIDIVKELVQEFRN